MAQENEDLPLPCGMQNAIDAVQILSCDGHIDERNVELCLCCLLADSGCPYQCQEKGACDKYHFDDRHPQKTKRRIYTHMTFVSGLPPQSAPS
mgnify:CR=1 FL=1